MDAIDQLGALAEQPEAADLTKGKGHKYRSKKKVGGRWVYDYGAGYGRGKPKKKDPNQLDLFADTPEPEKKFELETRDSHLPESPGVDNLRSKSVARQFADHVIQVFRAIESLSALGDKAAQRTVGGALNGAMRSAAHDLAAAGHPAMLAEMRKELHNSAVPKGSSHGTHQQLVQNASNNLYAGLTTGQKVARAEKRAAKLATEAKAAEAKAAKAEIEAKAAALAVHAPTQKVALPDSWSNYPAGKGPLFSAGLQLTGDDVGYTRVQVSGTLEQYREAVSNIQTMRAGLHGSDKRSATAAIKRLQAAADLIDPEVQERRTREREMRHRAREAASPVKPPAPTVTPDPSQPVTTPEGLSEAFDTLKPGQKIQVAWSTVMGSRKKGVFTTYTVGRRSTSKKYGITSITLLPEGVKKVSKYNRLALNKRRGGVSISTGDMGGSLGGIILSPPTEAAPTAPGGVGADGLTDHQRNRKERAQSRAERLQRRGEAQWEHSKAPLAGIPMGQPILAGHHSAKRHMRALETAHNRAGKAVATLDEAKSAEYAAKTAGRSISSDDPHATQALEHKLEGLEARRERIKAGNKGKKKDPTPYAGGDRSMYKQPGWVLSNLGAEIRRVKKRIDTLDAAAKETARPDIEGDGFTIEENKDDNRIRFHFDKKPSRDVINKMKRAGFKWSRSESAWQRQLNNAGRYAAGAVAKDVFGHGLDAGEKSAKAVKDYEGGLRDAKAALTQGGYYQRVPELLAGALKHLGVARTEVPAEHQSSWGAAFAEIASKWGGTGTLRDQENLATNIDRELRKLGKSSRNMDAIDALNRLVKSGDDDEAYMLGYKDAQAGKPAKPAVAAPQVDQEEADGDTDGVIENEQGNIDDQADQDAQGGPPEAMGNEEGAEPDAIDALAQQSQEGDEGTDLDGDGDADMPGQDVNGDGETDEMEIGGDPQAQDPGQGDPMEDGAPLPADDGDNHGVGDLDEDGQSESLIQEITNLEKLYYAAKGLHGGGHHKTDKALDLYHRAVRKLVRAQMGSSTPEEMQEPQDGTQPQDGAPPSKGRPPFGGKGNDNDEGGGDSGKPSQFGGGSDSGGNPDGEPSDNGEGEGEGEGDEKKKKPTFGKSFALDSLDTLTLQHGEPIECRPILNAMVKAGRSGPLDYLVNTVRLEVNAAKKAGPVDVGGLANLVVAKMVDRFTVDGQLQEAARQYHITAGSVSSIIERLLGIPSKDDPDIVKDSESHAAMGCERMAYSLDGSDIKLGDNALVKGAEGLRVVDHSPPSVKLVDDTVDPSRAFQNSQRARMSRMYKSAEAPVSLVTADCPFHGNGPDAVYKSHMINSGYLTCTCPKG